MAAVIQQALISYTNIDIARYIISLYQKIAYRNLIKVLAAQNLADLEKIHRFPYALSMLNYVGHFTCIDCDQEYQNYNKIYKCSYHYFDSRYHRYKETPTLSSRYFCKPCYNKLGYKHDWSIDEDIMKQYACNILQAKS
jgi:hypothetical protein